MSPLPEDAFSGTSAQLEEMAQLLSATPEWQIVKKAMTESWRQYADGERLMAAGHAALVEGGLDGATMLAAAIPQYAELLSAEQRDALALQLETYVMMSVAHEVEHGTPLPFLPIAGGSVTVEWADYEDMKMPIVAAFVTPLGDPVQRAEEFLAKCYQVMPDAFDSRRNSSRDAEWLARTINGETCKQIAVDDPRSGLAPEARVSPAEYRSEVAAAESRVTKAVQRIRKRWTKLGDSMSIE